uniref:EF-hand domain-containing protein n=1 Tax=Corethron hystrix TaxID=216773 RepID=A0A7S1BW97_9STRA
MNLSGRTTIESYKEAFDRIDEDRSGFIESNEVDLLLQEVYGERPPDFEIQAFLKFFDRNSDGKISWTEFQQGLGMMQVANKKTGAGWGTSGGEDTKRSLPPAPMDVPEPNVSGEIELEMEDGKLIKIDAKEYIDALKAEAQELKDALARESSAPSAPAPADPTPLGGTNAGPPRPASIPAYLATLPPENVKALTEGMGSDVFETMQRLVDFVLNGGPEGKEKGQKLDPKKELEIPGAALQKLALWQLILGYRLREEEAKGDFKKISSR